MLNSVGHSLDSQHLLLDKHSHSWTVLDPQRRCIYNKFQYSIYFLLNKLTDFHWCIHQICFMLNFLLELPLNDCFEVTFFFWMLENFNWNVGGRIFSGNAGGFYEKSWWKQRFTAQQPLAWNPKSPKVMELDGFNDEFLLKKQGDYFRFLCVNFQGCISYAFLEYLVFVGVDRTHNSQQYFLVLDEHLGKWLTFLLLLHINLREEAGRHWHIGVLSLLHMWAHDWFHMIYPRGTGSGDHDEEDSNYQYYDMLLISMNRIARDITMLLLLLLVMTMLLMILVIVMVFSCLLSISLHVSFHIWKTWRSFISLHIMTSMTHNLAGIEESSNGQGVSVPRCEMGGNLHVSVFVFGWTIP